MKHNEMPFINHLFSLTFEPQWAPKILLTPVQTPLFRRLLLWESVCNYPAGNYTPTSNYQISGYVSQKEYIMIWLHKAKRNSQT